jgi:hypothetical protein
MTNITCSVCGCDAVEVSASRGRRLYRCTADDCGLTFSRYEPSGSPGQRRGGKPWLVDDVLFRPDGSCRMPAVNCESGMEKPASDVGVAKRV